MAEKEAVPTIDFIKLIIIAENHLDKAEVK
jgi:hypothetical protein